MPAALTDGIKHYESMPRSSTLTRLRLTAQLRQPWRVLPE
jgi:hypothetical protein